MHIVRSVAHIKEELDSTFCNVIGILLQVTKEKRGRNVIGVLLQVTKEKRDEQYSDTPCKLPVPKTTTYGLRSFSYHAANQWNSLPDFFRTANFNVFEKALASLNFVI